ncbi:MAG: thiolase family protein [Pseudomonadota bacterium]
MKANDPVIVSAVRTPIGAFGGTLKNLSHTDLAAIVMDEVCRRVNFPKHDIDDIYWGIVMQRSDENGLARGAALRAGIPDHVSAVQVNRACCSGMEAIRIGSLAIRLNDAKAILAGGGESMSNIPYVLKDARWGLRLRHKELSDGLWDSLTDHYTGLIMGLTAENVADRYGVSRNDQDEFALESQMRVKKAVSGGRFKDEIVPVVMPGRGGKAGKTIDTDEHPKPETTLESLTSLTPTFKKDGTVTAGNASGINDGASSVLVLSHEMAEQLGMKRQWKIVGSTAVGVDPAVMGIGPIPAIKKLMQMTGYCIEDMDLFEINEAFAAPSVAVERELGLNRDIVNVNGGGIALGHPVGNSGCRVVVSLIHELEKRNLSRGCAALCGGSGHGQAMIIERVK